MKRNEKGFTLVELLGVIVILGLLMAIGIAAVTKYVQKGRTQAYDTMFTSTYDAAQNYIMEFNPFETSNATTVTIDIKTTLIELQYLEPLVDPSDNSIVCGGEVTVTPTSTGTSTEALASYKYVIEINCNGKTIGTKTYTS